MCMITPNGCVQGHVTSLNFGNLAVLLADNEERKKENK